MPVGTLAAVALAVLAAAPLPPGALTAQEVVDLPGRDRRLQADFEEVFRVGVMDGEPWEMLGAVRHVAFDASGNLYVVDGLGAGGGGLMGSEGLRVLVFDASGAFVRSFGSAGEGPGEFNRPGAFAVMRDGTTVVSDAGHRAYQLFDAHGEFLRMVRGGGRLGAMHPDPRGGGVFTGGFGGRSFLIGVSEDAPQEPPTSRPVLRVGLDGEEVRTDTVVEGWMPPRDDEEIDLPRNIDIPDRAATALGVALRGLSQRTIFEPPLLAGVLPDGSVVHSDSSAYALKITPPGTREPGRVIRRPLRPAPVTPAVRKEWRERREAARREGVGGGRQLLLRMESAAPGGANQSGSSRSFSLDMPEPDFHPEIPVLRRLSATWEGRIWVQRRGDELESDGPIDVVTADGRYVGTLASDATGMPDAFGPEGMAAFIELDDLDVASVVVRRLPATIR